MLHKALEYGVGWDDTLREAYVATMDTGDADAVGAALQQARKIQVAIGSQELRQAVENGKLIISIVSDGSDLAITIDELTQIDPKTGKAKPWRKSDYAAAGLTMLPIVPGSLVRRFLNSASGVIIEISPDVWRMADNIFLDDRHKEMFKRLLHRGIENGSIENVNKLGEYLEHAKNFFPDDPAKQRQYLLLLSHKIPPEHAKRLADVPIKAPRASVALPHTQQLTDYLYRRIDPTHIKDAHHAAHHSMPRLKQAEILNDWDQFVRGTNYNGKEVDIFLKDGYVVITEAGEKTRVITSYGREFSKNKKPVNPKRWNFNQWDEGEFYYSPIHRNTQR